MALVSPFDGYPYVFGGRAPPYFDCSGLIEWSFNKLGIKLSGTAEDMYNQTVPVDNPAPGDLVFFSGTYKPGISHIGIYIGDNKMFNAGGTHLHYADLDKPYWKEHFSGIRRVK
ncbi:C40 family peptidase [Bacillus toyonensis]